MTLSAQETWAIDTHAHIYPSWYLDALNEQGVPSSSTDIARNLGADSMDEDLRRRLEWMDKAEVRTQIIAVTPQAPWGRNPQKAGQIARRINDEYARVVSEYPGRFLAYMALPLPHVEESVAEIGRIFSELPAVGISLPTFLLDGTSLADPRLDPVWEALDAARAVVNIHPTGSGVRSPLINDKRLEWVNGAPVEDATAVLHLLKADIPARYPNVRFHVAHLGGDLPFLMQRIEDNYEDWSAFAHSPNQSMRSMFFDAANFHEPSLRLAAESFGSGQILAGSDHPYFQNEKYVRAFDYIRTSRLDEEEKAKVLHSNASGLYGLED